VPGARRAVRKLIGHEALDLGEPPSQAEASSSSSSQPTASAAPPAQPKPRQTDSERFTLTPDKLADISEFNPQLEEIGESLESVPVFTAAVGNGTAPLTVPAENGRKLAYFFTEHADAEAFLQAVRQNTGVDLKAQVIGVSLADIIRAYSSPEAKEAQETFVLIPTMAEVAEARRLIAMAGTSGDEDPKLGPGNGLVPVFWSDVLAVQTAAGKQRKVLFFRLSDLQQMWTNLAEARKENGELDDLPDGPDVKVSSLQHMAGLLASSNKTDEVMFLPSSTALRRAQAGRKPAGSEAAEEAAAAPATASGGDVWGADGAGAGEEAAAEGFDDGFEGEEEDATGGAI